MERKVNEIKMNDTLLSTQSSKNYLLERKSNPQSREKSNLDFDLMLVNKKESRETTGYDNPE